MSEQISVHGIYSDIGCLYAEVQVHGVTSRLLIDNGSPVSILSYAEFLNLGLDERSLQRFEPKLTTANGGKLEVEGWVPLSFQVGSTTFEQSFIVATIDSLAGILGMDFFKKYEGELQLGRDMLVTNKGKVKLYKKETSNCALIKPIKELMVPSHSEKSSECKPDSGLPETTVLVEPKTEWGEKGSPVTKVIGQEYSSIPVTKANTIIRSDQLGQVSLNGCTEEHKIPCSNLKELLDRTRYCQDSVKVTKLTLLYRGAGTGVLQWYEHGFGPPETVSSFTEFPICKMFEKNVQLDGPARDGGRMGTGAPYAPTNDHHHGTLEEEDPTPENGLMC